MGFTEVDGQCVANATLGCKPGDAGCKCYYMTPGTCSSRAKTNGEWRPDPWAPGYRDDVLVEANVDACLRKRKSDWTTECGAIFPGRERQAGSTRLALSKAHARDQVANYDGTPLN